MPPTAAATGRAARAGSRRSPATNSRLSSRPATKKKIASRPSAAQVARVRSRCSDARPDPQRREVGVGLRPGGVRPDQGDRGGADEQGAADGLPAQHVADPGCRARSRGRTDEGGSWMASGSASSDADQTSRHTGGHRTSTGRPGGASTRRSHRAATPSSLREGCLRPRGPVRGVDLLLGGGDVADGVEPGVDRLRGARGGRRPGGPRAGWRGVRGSGWSRCRSARSR